MFIIFDLDDTLIETSKCLGAYNLKRALEEMMSEGLNVDFSQAFPLLLQLNQTALSSKIALQTFFATLQADESILHKGLASMNKLFPSDLAIEPVPNALEVLETLQQEHRLAIVTMGDEQLQRQKMKKAGIQPQQFSKLIISKSHSKKNDYQVLLNEFALDIKEVMVCGDRVPIDLTPAKELGLFTVHMQNGRGLFQNKPIESIDRTIKNLKELHEVL